MDNYCKPASIIPHNDDERLKKLHGYEILYTPPEEAFDKIAKLAAQIFGAPGAFISFVDKDKVFFKSNVSLMEGNIVDRKDSLCSLAILEDKQTMFNDTHQIPDLLEFPYVSAPGGIRFYAGSPLKTSEGHKLGTLCVTDSVPRQATPEQLNMLATLSTVVTDQLELRLAARKAIRVQTDLMNITVHDLKGPVSNISLLTDLLVKRIPDNEDVNVIAGKMKIASGDIMGRLDSLLNLSEIENGDIKVNIEPVDLADIIRQVAKNFELQAKQKGQKIKTEPSAPSPLLVSADSSRIQEVMENLLSNAIKYSYSDSEITIVLAREGKNAIVEIRDQGQGLNEDDMNKLFRKFTKLSSFPTGKERSNGLGLSIVKTLVELQKGKVWAKSEGKGKGASFFVSLPLAQASV